MGSIANAIVQGGYPNIDLPIVETATNMYPGRLAKKGTADTQVVVGTALCSPTGWIGYEQASPGNRPASIETAYAANDEVPILSGGKFNVLATLTTSQTVTKDDPLVAAANGMVQKAAALTLDSGSTDVTSAAANGAIISGSIGDGVIVAYADESVTTTSKAKTIRVRSAI